MKEGHRVCMEPPGLTRKPSNKLGALVPKYQAARRPEQVCGRQACRPNSLGWELGVRVTWKLQATDSDHFRAGGPHQCCDCVAHSKLIFVI